MILIATKNIVGIHILIYFATSLVVCNNDIPFCRKRLNELRENEKDWRNRCLNGEGQNLATPRCEADKEYNYERMCMYKKICFHINKGLPAEPYLLIKSTSEIHAIDLTTPKTTVATQTTNIATLKTTVATLKTNVATLKTTVATLKTNVAILKTTVPTLKTTFITLKRTVAILKTTVAILKTTVAILKTTVTATLNTTVASLNATVAATLNTTVATLKTTVEILKTTGANLKTTAKTLKTTVATLETTVATLKTTVATIKTTVAILMTTVAATLNTTVAATLNTTVATLNTTVVISGLARGRMEIDTVDNNLYIADSNSISRVNLVDMCVEVILQNLSVDDIAVDWIKRRLYWAEYSKKQISVANLDGKNKIVLMNTTSYPSGIAMDPTW
ncbi:Hypothetical predicted protein, partial [Paramuricea clavata]